MQKSGLFLLFSLMTLILSGQVAPDKYWVRFTDKNNSPYSIENPQEFLSQRAIDRRVKQGIEIVENDLPVNPQYLEGVSNTGATILTVSKWFNSVTVKATSQSIVDAIEALPYVLSVSKATGKKLSPGRIDKPFFKNETYGGIPAASAYKSGVDINVYDYGAAYNQIHMLNGEVLHNSGYAGQGMIIAVLDAGFYNVNSLQVFDTLWNNNRIIATKDFVNPQNPQIFTSHHHGTMVLSTMGGNLPGQMVGTAPEASYILLRTEDVDSEYLIEELNWVSGAEYADSAGADVLNTSLGYNEFDDPDQNHTYEDMDGNTTPITIGADIAASKGMIVVNSAGNSGSANWYYITAPADGDSVFTVGAVDANGAYVYFSSHGPTYDGRVKPNVMAQGYSSTVVDPFSGQVSSGSGTSFSSPITAGIITCLWQANPDKSNIEIMHAVEQSASQYSDPDGDMGYGIPDYAEANNILTVIEHNPDPVNTVSLFPNPFSDEIILKVYPEDVRLRKVKIVDITGKTVFSKLFDGQKSGDKIILNGLGDMKAGVYFIQLDFDTLIITKKIFKE